MNAEKLAKQLKKELTRNPKKTAALGLVTLVALWFWAPLAWKWMGGDSKKKPKTAATAEAAPATAAPAVDAAGAATPQAAPTPKIAWDLLLDRIADDKQMATARLADGARDPFAVTTVEAQVVAAAPAVTEATGTSVPRPMAQDPTPESAGLALEATFVSRQARRATISGKTYQVGDRVKVQNIEGASQGATQPEAPATTALEYEVTAIEARRVALTRNGKEFLLVLKRESLGEDEQLTFGAVPQP